jgi:hypothetical protein
VNNLARAMKSTSLTTTTSVIQALGGSAQVARLTGRKLSAASNWHRAQAFPANTYVALSAALRARRLHAPVWLWGTGRASMEPRKSERRTEVA